MRNIVVAIVVVLGAGGAARAADPECRWSTRFAGTGPAGQVWATAVYDDGSGPALYAAGEFEAVGGSIARWDGTGWAPLTDASTGKQGLESPTLPPVARTLAVHDDGNGAALYVGGVFSGVAGVTATNVARWDGSRWSALIDSGTGEEGADGPVTAFGVYDAGDGAELYVAGSFTTVGGVTATRIARWDGTSWTPLTDLGTAQEGVDGGVRDLVVHDDGGGAELYLGGSFTSAGGVAANRIARWDGSHFSPLTDTSTGEQGADGTVLALAVHDDGGGPALYAAGLFASAGDVTATRIVRWDGAHFTPLTDAGTGEEGADDSVGVLEVHDDGAGEALFVAGGFSTIGGVSATRIARWDGTGFTPLTDAGTAVEGVDDDVGDLAVFDDGGGAALYVSARFLGEAGGVAVDGIARWDGASWSALEPTAAGHDGIVDGDRVLAAQVYDDGGGPALYVGGSFTSAGGVAASHIARWDGSGWEPLTDADTGQEGTDSWVVALAVFDDGGGAALYAGGRFATAGGRTVDGIARWDGTRWASLAGTGIGTPGVLNKVSTLAVHDDGGGPALYLGGSFVAVDGVAAGGIARWDGASWSALTDATTGQQGVDSSVRALATYDDGGGPALFAGGPFTTAGGKAATGIARWDGTHWEPLTDAITGQQGASSTRALAVHDAGAGPALFVGGVFTAAGGVTANRIARWDGTHFTALTDAGTGQEGMDLPVSALHVHDDGSGAALYAGGEFENVAGMPMMRAARWDGARFTPLVDAETGEDGANTNKFIYIGLTDLASYDDGSGPALFAFGDFTRAGGRPSALVGAYACTTDRIFEDGFESQSTCAWDAATPPVACDG